MANNSFLKSPFDDVAADRFEPISADEVKSVPRAPVPRAPEPASPPAAISRSSLRDFTVQRAQELGVDPGLALAILHQESGGNPNVGNSPKGAVGPGQVMPATYKAMMGTSDGQNDPFNSVEAGLRYLAYGQRRIGTRDPAILAAGYHSGMDRASLRRGEIPNTSDGLISTADYAANVARRAGAPMPADAATDVSDRPARRPLLNLNRYEPLSADDLKSAGLGGDDDRYESMTSAEFDAIGAPAAPAPADGGGFMGTITDIGKNLKIGMNTAAADARELTRRIPGVGESIVSGLDAVDRWTHPPTVTDLVSPQGPIKDSGDLLNRDTQQMTQSMTPAMREALGKKWWDSEKGSFGPAWSDWRSYAGGVVQSLPEQALTMVPAMRLAKGVYAAKVASGAATPVAAAAAARAAQVAGSLMEGLLGGAQSSREIRDKVNQLPQDVLDTSEAYKALLEQGLSAADARKTLAEDLSSRAFVTSGVVTGAFGGMGDRALAKLFVEQVGKKAFADRIKAFAKGAIAEGLLEELPQSAGQQVAQNEAMQQANPKQSLGEDVANQALGGAVLGGLQGGSMGAVAHGRGAPAQPTAAVPAQAATPAQSVVQEEPVEPAATAQPTTTAAAPLQPADNAPSTARGPLQRATENAASQPDRVTVQTPEGAVTGHVAAAAEDGTVQIVTDDGEVVTFNVGQEGISITPEAPNAPLSNALEAASIEHADESRAGEPAADVSAAAPEIEAAPAPVEPVAATPAAEAPVAPAPDVAATPAPTDLAAMDEPTLRARLKYIAEQAKTNGGWDARLTKARREVEKEIGARAKAAAPSAASIDEPPVPAGMTRLYHGSATHGRTDGKAWFSTNREYARNYREGAELQYVDYPTEKVNAAIDPDGYGQSVANGFTWNAELDSSETGRRKILKTTAAVPAPKKPKAAPRPAARQRIEKGQAVFGTAKKAQTIIDQQGLADTHEVVKTGKVRFEVKPKAAPAAQAEATAVAPAPVAAAPTPVQSAEVSALRKQWTEAIAADDNERARAISEQISEAKKAAAPAEPGFQKFDEASGTLGIPRAEMPQIATESHGGLVRHLNANGIEHETKMVDAGELKPTQAEFSPERVTAAKDADGDRAVIVSSDGHIIDGHHQVLAAQEAGEDVKAIVLDAPIDEALEAVKNSPSAAAEEAKASAPAPKAKKLRAKKQTTGEKASVAEAEQEADTGAHGTATQQHRDLADRLLAGFAGLQSGERSALWHAVAPAAGEAGRDHRAVAGIAKRLFGRDVVFLKFAGAPLFNGVVSKRFPGVIFLNAESQKPLMAVLGHELLHEMAKSAPGIYRQLSTALDSLIKNDSLYAAREAAKYRRHGLDPSKTDFREELEGDIVGDRFDEPEFWQAVAQEQPGAFKRIAARVIAWLDGIARRASGRQPFGTDRFLKDVAAARAAVADAVRQFSATEVGAVASESDDIRFKVADTEPDDAGLTPPEPGFVERVQSAVQDNMNRVKKVQERIQKMTGRPMPEIENYYGAETNRPGRIAARLEDAKTFLTGPLMADLAKSGHTQEQLGELLHAMHAKERNERVAAINPDMPDGGSGMTNAKADEILAKHKDDAALHKLADRARDIAKRTLDLKLAYGLIDKETHETLSTVYDHYVPLKGDGEFGPKIKRAMGHEERQEHILENLARDYDQAVVVGEKNLARQSLLAMTLKNPDDELWSVGMPPRGRYVAGKTYEVRKNGKTEATFTSPSQVSAFLEAKGSAASQYEVRDSGGERVQQFVKPLQDNEVMVYVGGRPVRIQIQDEALARQLRPLDQGRMNPILEFMRGTNRYLSKIYTGYNPSFIIRNTVRDAVTGSINMLGNEGAGVAAKAWARYPAAVAAMGRYAATGAAADSKVGKYLQEYRNNGGKTGASWMSDLEAHGKTLEQMFEDAYGANGYLRDGKPGKAAKVAGRKIVGGMAHVVEIANQATENGLRLALYMALRDAGETPGRAAQAAKSVTVDFDRKGSMTGALGAIYLFFNPAVQGTANALKTLTKGKHKQQAWAALGALALLGFYAAAAGMDDDKDRWLGEGWESRSKNLILKVGDKRLKVPMSQEFAPFYGFGAALAEAARGESKLKSAAHMVSSFIDAYFPLQGAFNPDSDEHGMDAIGAAMPTIIKPGYQSAVNRNSFGSQIVPENEFTKERPDNLKMFRGTKNSAYDAAAQGIAKAGEVTGAGRYENDITKVSPETLKHLWRTYTGGLGAFVTDAAGVARMTGEDAGQVQTSDVPIVKDFIKDADVKAIRGRFYDLAKTAKSASAEFKAAKKAGDAEAMEQILSRPGTAELVGLDKLIRTTAAAAAKIRDEEVTINADKTLTPSQKRAALKDLERQEEDLYRGAISAFK